MADEPKHLNKSLRRLARGQSINRTTRAYLEQCGWLTRDGLLTKQGHAAITAMNSQTEVVAKEVRT